MTVAETFAEWVATIAPPEEAVEAAHICFMDWLGGAIAGAVEMPATGLRRALPRGGPARLLPDGRGADPRTAALINGAASHTVEVDDIYSPGLYHPGVVTIPAALAMAETAGASGARLLRAIIAGYEVGNRIARAVNPAHYRLWHTTATVGHFGAAVAAAAAAGLGPRETAHAIANAATFAAGLRHAFASDAMSKPLHAGRAAEAGVLSAMAAGEGVTGVLDILEGKRGFGAAMSGAVDWGAAVETLGDEWTILRTTVKAHACCGHSFAALDAIDRLMRDEKVDAGEIAAIEIGAYRATVEICGNPAPATPVEARFSLPWCAAVMARDRSVTPAAHAPERMADPALLALAARVRVVLDADAEAAFPDLRPAIVTIRLTDGRSFTHRQRTRRGDPDDPLSMEEIGEKFRRLVAPVIGIDATLKLQENIASLSKMTEIAALPLWQSTISRDAGARPSIGQ